MMIILNTLSQVAASHLPGFFLAQAQMPIPRDLELALPLDSALLKGILVVLFLAHILFVNLMVGGSILTVFFEILGRYNYKYDAVARRIGTTITVNKSLAVVLGVGPLLCINLVYTLYFYSANALTGYAWISVIPFVIIAFLITYLHKYTWERWSGPSKNYHIMIGAGGTLFFLIIPLIFLSNVNLMLFPDKWTEVHGFFSSLQFGNVFPRYFHFLTASLAVTGLFLAGWFGRRKFPVESLLPGFSRPQLRRLFYRIAFWVTVVQLLFGPLLLLTLPSRGISGILLWTVVGAIVLAAVVLVLLWREIRSDDRVIGHTYAMVWVVFSLLVLLMGTARHLYREAAIDPHWRKVEDRTDTFRSVELATQMRLAAGLGAGEAMGGGPTGESVFKNCASCHAVNKVLAGPSLREIYSIYANNPEGIVQWAKNPGNKRPEFQPMPSMAHLGEERLEMVADYILQKGAPEEASSGEAAQQEG